MSAVVLIDGQVFRLVQAKSRREELWEESASLCEQLKKIAESDKSDINKVEGAKDVYLDLRQKLRELGVW